MKKRILQLILALLLVLTGCSAGPAPTEPTETDPPVTEIALVVTEDTISQLDEYPELVKADLTGSTCYGAIQAYQKTHPEVEVIYTLDLGGTMTLPDVQELTLEEGKYDLQTLRDCFAFLKGLKRLSFPQTQLTAQELEQLGQSYDVSYSVRIGEAVLESDAQSADLSALTQEDVAAATERMELLPNLTEVELMDGEGNCSLSLADVAVLQEAAPNVMFHYSFDLFGQVVSTTDEEITYANKYIGNKVENAEEQLRQALTVLKGCKRFVLDNCHFENEVLAQIRDEFRDTTKLVWRVWFGSDGSCLTDREVIRYMPTLGGKSSKNLIYCEDARFIDVGHNESLTNVDFVAKMTKLEAIIISGSPVKDMSAFAGCESLEFLELAYCMYVEDISPLAQCKNLKRLNIAYTGVTDLSPLDELELTVMVDNHSKVPNEERERFEQLHPDCLTLHTTDQPYGYPWRYTEEGEWNEYYAMLREIFDYDHPAQTRW